MRRPFPIFVMLALAITLTLGSTQRAKACFDIIPQIHKVTCYYDTIQWQELIVRVGSLRTATKAPGTWCTCAYRNPSPALDLVRYIIVVDSGTNNPTPGFAPWYELPAASSAWDSVYANLWRGFVGRIDSAGTVAGRPIELIIRVQMNVGYALIPLMDDVPTSISGWGEWDDSLKVVMPTRWWVDWPTDSNFVWVPIHNADTFFAGFDSLFNYVGLNTPTIFSGLQLYPNPATDVLNLRIPNPLFAFHSVGVYDVNGRPIVQGLSSVTNQLTIDVSALAGGVYFVRFQTAKGVVTRRFVKTDYGQH